MAWTCSLILLTYREIDWKFNSLETVQLPVKNHLILDVSSDDLY